MGRGGVVVSDHVTTDNVIEHEGWRLVVRDGEPLIADDVLAERLGATLYKLRRLIERNARAGAVTPAEVLPTVGKTPRGGRPGRRYLLGEADALFIVTRSESPRAVALTKAMIGVFLAVHRRLSAPAVLPPALSAGHVDVQATLREALSYTEARQRRVLLTAVTGCDEETLLRRAPSLAVPELLGAATTLGAVGDWCRAVGEGARRVLAERPASRPHVAREVGLPLFSAARTAAARRWPGGLAVHLAFGESFVGLRAVFLYASERDLEGIADAGPVAWMGSAARVLEACARVAQGDVRRS